MHGSCSNCSVLQCVAELVRYSNLFTSNPRVRKYYSVLQCILVCCSVIQCAAATHSHPKHASARNCSILQCNEVCYNMSQRPIHITPSRQQVIQRGSRGTRSCRQQCRLTTFIGNIAIQTSPHRWRLKGCRKIKYQISAHC